MKARAALLLGLTVAGCSPAAYQPPASLYRHYGDRLKVYFGGVLGKPCGIADWRGQSGLSASSCYVFGAPRTMEGVLRTERYGLSRFFEGRTTLPQSGADWDRSGSTVSDRYRLRRPWSEMRHATDYANTSRAYRVRFVGRETARYGPRGTERIVIVDRIDAIRRLPNP